MDLGVVFGNKNSENELSRSDMFWMRFGTFSGVCRPVFSFIEFCEKVDFALVFTIYFAGRPCVVKALSHRFVMKLGFEIA